MADKELTQEQIDRHLIKLARREIKEWQRFIEIIHAEMEERLRKTAIDKINKALERKRDAKKK